MREIDQALLNAVRNEDIDEVKSLLDQEASPEAEDKNRLSSMYFAIQGKNIEIVKLFINKGLDINAQDSVERTPLYYAAIFHNKEIINWLLEHGADPNIVSSKYMSPLFRIVAYSYPDIPEIAQILIKYGADVHYKGGRGMTLLHMAVYAGHIELVKLFVDKGLNINALDTTDNTPIRLVLRDIDLGCPRSSSSADMLFTTLSHGATLNDNDRSIINAKSDLKNCLEAFKKIKAMPHLGRVIETYKNRNKRENANIVAQYVNDEAKEQKLIEELQTIKISCNSNERLSFIPEYLFSIVEDMIEDYRKIKIGNEVAGDFVRVINSADDTNKTVYPGSSDIGSLLNQYLDDQDIKNLALVNKKNYEEERFNEPLNKLLTKLQEVCKGSSIVTEPKLEELSHNNQRTT